DLATPHRHGPRVGAPIVTVDDRPRRPREPYSARFPPSSRIMEPTMDLGRLLLRLTIGGTFFVHGTQKLFGWFGGYGPDGTGQYFESVGLRPGRRNAIAAGATETVSGILIALGAGTPLAAAGLSGGM